MTRIAPPPSERTGAEKEALPRWLGMIFLASAGALALWTVWLTFDLPSRHLSPHWDVAWGGIDVMLALALGATGIATVRDYPWLLGAAVCAATLLTVDAWFDCLTANGGHELVISLVQAVFIELPLAAACLYAAVRRR
jgi:hypothetical protein